MVNIPVPCRVVFERGLERDAYFFLKPGEKEGTVVLVVRNANPYDSENTATIADMLKRAKERYGTTEGVLRGLADYHSDTIHPGPIFPEYQPPS